ncbi:MAG: DUF6713 family protein [Pseudomonadota bacterium]
MVDWLYLAMLASFFTHELDAVKRHEWRVLPLTSFLPEAIGEQVFIWMHVPLFLAILTSGESEGFRLGLSVFAVIHVGLHWAFRNHPAYEFDNASSWGLIVLTGVLGGAYLIVTI